MTRVFLIRLSANTEIPVRPTATRHPEPRLAPVRYRYVYSYRIDAGLRKLLVASIHTVDQHSLPPVDIHSTGLILVTLHTHATSVRTT